jgi:hypothetical protein
MNYFQEKTFGSFKPVSVLKGLLQDKRWKGSKNGDKRVMRKVFGYSGYGMMFI